MKQCSQHILLVLACLLLWPSATKAQLNTDRLITIGRSALYYEDYVLSMQYFNQAIAVKPWLYEPWFFRAVAKYYLDDYAGAEADCTEALGRNPYVVNIYELRGLTRIQQKKFQEAIGDYSRALRHQPDNRGLWHNRVLCHIQCEEYDEALLELDTIQQRWSQYAGAWSLRADVLLHQKDTTAAVEALSKSLELDPYDGNTWAQRSQISLTREEWSEAEEQLNHAIHLMPRHAGCHINRALARFNQQNLRGAMADYDMALDLEPNNFLGHYNRGLLRAQVGDDNRAITDFDFVLRLEPDNMLALFNRAVLLDKTGDLTGAIRDYSKVIDEFPNFWTGLEFRAACYRRLGQTAKAEADEFTVYRARLYKHLYGTQPRLDPKQLRRRSDIDPDKYNQLVVDDEQEPEREYKSDYRGRVQDHRTNVELQPLYALSLEPQSDELSTFRPANSVVDELNERLSRTIYICLGVNTYSEHATSLFLLIDTLTNNIQQSTDTRRAVETLLIRAIAYTAAQDYDAAVADLDNYLAEDSASVAALWQRAVCRTRQGRFLSSIEANIGANASEHLNSGTPTLGGVGSNSLLSPGVLADLTKALALSPGNPYLLYNRGTILASTQDYAAAIADFSEAISQEPQMAAAWFNRGLCHLWMGDQQKAIADLSKAGEQGLYAAYSIIKRQQRQ